MSPEVLVRHVKNALLLARVDLKDLFHSFSFYLLLGLVVLIVRSMTLSYFCESHCTVIVIDSVKNALSRRIISDFAEKGFKIKEEGDYNLALRMVREQFVSFAINIEAGGIEIIHFSPTMGDFFKDRAEGILHRIKIERYRSRLEEELLRSIELNTETKDVFGEVKPSHHLTINRVAGGIWIISAGLTAIMWVLSLDSFPKLERKYTTWEIFLGKLTSFITVGLICASVFFVSMIGFGVGYGSLAGLIFAFIMANVSGVMTGFLVAIFPSLFTRDKVSAMMGALLGVILFFYYCNLLGGIFFPIAHLPGPVWHIARYIPSYNVIRLSEWMGSTGYGLGYEVVRDLLGRLAVVTLAEATFIFILLKKF
jgi:hypothetical protein